MDAFDFLIPAALAAVTLVLVAGIYTLYRGGDVGRSWSNRLMRLRVLTQFVAILILVGAMIWRANH